MAQTPSQPTGWHVLRSEYVPLSVTAKLAPWIVGALLDIFLAGLAISLVSNYFFESQLLALLTRSKTNHSQRRSKPTAAIPGSNTSDAKNRYDWASASCRVLVVIVTALSIFKTICSLYIMLLIGVLRRGEDEYLANIEYNHWSCVTGPITTSLIGLAVQTFYLNRLHKLLRAQDDSFLGSLWFRVLLMTIIISLALISVAFAGATTQFITTKQFSKLNTFFSVHFETMFACDALITIFTIICILRTGRRVVMDQRSLLSRFVRLTVISAAIPAILALLNLAFLLPKNQYIIRWHATANFALGKAYLFTLLWTLEYRKRVTNGSADSRNFRQRHEALSVHDSRRSPSGGSPLPQAFTLARTMEYYDIELQGKPSLH